ncbi:Uncharacterised protein [Mycobacteroides abscessus subsp. abscessus]|nr:Uncharacterised protein [Mycobacteroides abscessus subsp. abscessus]
MAPPPTDPPMELLEPKDPVPLTPPETAPPSCSPLDTSDWQPS